MTESEISAIIESQKKYYNTGATLPVDFREEQLSRLYSSIKRHECEIKAALLEDLGKSSYEAFMCEIGLVLSEISYLKRHVARFSSRRRVHTPFAQFASVSYIQPMPRGVTLIMSPWNYPILLTLEPLADSIAAGNTAVLKPSAYSPSTSRIIEKIISECFPPEYITVVSGGREENNSLLSQNFDFVFFTGSQNVGREVLRRSAEHLTPAVLELGGKSPCIVDETADIPLAARRIVFGKYLNCGQTCVAPDYIICKRDIKDRLTEEIIRQIHLQYGKSPLENADYGKIINAKHFDRISALIDPNKVICGGSSRRESLQIEPTVMDNVCKDDAVMKEEIFGPILPILVYDDFDKMLFELKTADSTPLALYLFSTDKNRIRRTVREIPYGGGCINDCIIHLASSELGFGGIGKSGMGSYHGKHGFDTFSHTKSVVDKKNFIDLPMRYQPYTVKLYERLLRLFLK